MTRKRTILVLAALLFSYGVYLLVSAHNASDNNRARMRPKTSTPASEQARLARDLQRLNAISQELQTQHQEMKTLQQTVGLRERGYYTSDESDKIESLLFRYLLCRESLWDMVAVAVEEQDHFTKSDEQAKAFLIGFGAALRLTYYSSNLVVTFYDEPAVVAKLNEAHHRTGIPRGTYDQLFTNVTSIDNIEAVKTAWELVRAEVNDDNSRVAKLLMAEPAYRDLVDQFETLYQGSVAQIQTVLEKSSLLLPEVRNRLRHTAITALAKKALAIHEDNLYAARATLFLRISRLKSPVYETVDFGKDKISRIKSALQPGDIILTYKDGYMSNIFLPGVFKHGITYVGSPDERKRVGLTPANIKRIPKGTAEKLSADLIYATLPSGHPADLIEAVAEGVVFNSLEDLLSTQHVNRLVILRPALTAEERRDALLAVFRLLGCGYDFKFDFNDATFQCCTEVIYRALNARGEVALPLTQRMGTQTLSADDILNYHLAAAHTPFTFVLLAEKDPDSNRAGILTTVDGQKRLNALMAESIQ